MSKIRTRKEKATLNILTSIIYEIVALICGLILPRVILLNFGSVYNGLVSSITQFLALISILRLGISGATRAALYKPLAENDLAGMSSIVKATEIYMRKVGFVIVAYVVLLALGYPLLVDTGLSYLDVSLIIIAVGINAFAQYYFGITYQAFLSAAQCYYIYNISQTICTFANTIISIALIYLGCTIQIVKFGSSIIFFLTPLLLNLYVTKEFHLDKKSAPNNAALDKKNDVLGHSLANIVNENTDVVVLTLFCDIKIVSVYTVYNLVISALKKILNIFSTGTEAIFGDMWANKEYDRISKHLRLYEYVIGVFISIVFSSTLLLIIPFVKIYTEKVNDTNYLLPSYAFLIVIAQAFYCFRTPYLTLVQGVGHYKETKNGAYMEAAINILVSVILVQFIGICGTAIGTLIANMFRSFQYEIYIDKNICKLEKYNLLKRILWIGINILITFGILNIFIDNFITFSWLRWVLSGLICVIVASFTTIVKSFVFYRESMICTIQIAKEMFLKKRGYKSEKRRIL